MSPNRNVFKRPYAPPRNPKIEPITAADQSQGGKIATLRTLTPTWTHFASFRAGNSMDTDLPWSRRPLVRREGIEPSSQAWEAHILPMNYRRISTCEDGFNASGFHSQQRTMNTCVDLRSHFSASPNLHKALRCHSAGQIRSGSPPHSPPAGSVLP
jgi:hypothetical protein